MSVVITGAGVISAVGSGDAFFPALAAGKCGIGEVTLIDPGDTESVLAAEAAEFAVEDYLDSVKSYLDRASAFTLAAGALALRDADFAVAPGEGNDAGISFGTAYGCLGTMGVFWEGVLAKGAHLASSLLFSHSYTNTPVSLAAIEFNLAGPHGAFCTGAASAGHALADAAAQLRFGRARAMLAGGAEALTPFLYAAAAGSGRLSPGKGGEEGLRPFAASRNGTVLGEGAALLLLETEEAARERGARIRAHLLGCGVGSTPEAAMAGALAEGECATDTVDAVFAAAAGQPEDAGEAHALESVFGGRQLPVVALKALAGETLGASGALAAVAAVGALEQDLLPGSAALEVPEFPLDLVRAPRQAPLRRVLVNCLDAQGGCVSLLLGKA